MMYRDGDHSVRGWGGDVAAMTVTMLLFWALVAAGLIVLLRGGWPRSGPSDRQPPAEADRLSTGGTS